MLPAAAAMPSALPDLLLPRRPIRSLLQQSARAQQFVHAPRRFDSSHMMQAAMSGFGAFQMPRMQMQMQQVGGDELPAPSRPESFPIAEDASAVALLDWPDHLRETYKLGRVYGHGALRYYAFSIIIFGTS